MWSGVLNRALCATVGNQLAAAQTSASNQEAGGVLATFLTKKEATFCDSPIEQSTCAEQQRSLESETSKGRVRCCAEPQRNGGSPLLPPAAPTGGDTGSPCQVGGCGVCLGTHPGSRPGPSRTTLGPNKVHPPLGRLGLGGALQLHPDGAQGPDLAALGGDPTSREIDQATHPAGRETRSFLGKAR